MTKPRRPPWRCLEMLRGGFTMFIEPGSLFSTDAAARAVERVGMRALFAPLYLWDRRECFDAVPSLYSESLMARAPISLERSLDQLDAELGRNRDPGRAGSRLRIRLWAGNRVAGVCCKPRTNAPAPTTRRCNSTPGYVPGEGDIYRALNGVSQLVHLRELGHTRRTRRHHPRQRTGR